MHDLEENGIHKILVYASVRSYRLYGLCRNFKGSLNFLNWKNIIVVYQSKIEPSFYLYDEEVSELKYVVKNWVIIVHETFQTIG